MSALKKYALEIYLPGNPGSDVACLVESDEVFLPIRKGDFINPSTWTAHYSQNLQAGVHTPPPHGILLRVTGVEHFIVQRDEGFSQHKLGVFTEAVDNVAESRVPPGKVTSSAITDPHVAELGYKLRCRLAEYLAGAANHMVPPGLLGAGMGFETSNDIAEKYDAESETLTVTGLVTLKVARSEGDE